MCNQHENNLVSNIGFIAGLSRFTERAYSRAPSFTRADVIIGKKQEASHQTPDDFPFINTRTILNVNINNKTLPFPLPNKDLVAVTTWQGSEERAPFLNRKQFVLALLEAVCPNFYEPESKPTYAVLTMNPGSGKTRLQIEWIYHALNDKEIVTEFLTIDTDRRKSFLNLLYTTAYIQRAVLAHFRGLRDTTTRPHELILQVLRNNMLDRFKGQKIDIGDQTVCITQELFKKLTSKTAAINQHIDLFYALVDKYCKRPETLPFDDAQLPEKKLLIFGLDECQIFSDKEPDSDEDNVYKLLNAASRLKDEMATTSWFWFLTGVRGSLKHNTLATTDFHLLNAPMDGLLKADCLDRISRQYFGKSLPLTAAGRQNSKAYLHNLTARALVQLYYRTYGVPRAIETLVGVVRDGITKMESYCSTECAEAVKSHFVKENMQQISEEFATAIAPKYITETPIEIKAKLSSVSETQRKEIKAALEYLDIKAAFCAPLESKAPIPHLDMTPEELESLGFLIQWSNINKHVKQYSRPPFCWTVASKEFALLGTTARSVNWLPLTISRLTLILHANLASWDADTTGNRFGETLAASLYARYILATESTPVGQERPEICLRDVFDCSALPEVLQNARVAWRGVVCLQHHITSRSNKLLDEIKQNNVIAVNSKNSKSHIIVPAKIEEQGVTKEIFIDIRATNIGELKLSYTPKSHSFTLPASAIVSPIVQSYFGFASVFEGGDSRKTKE